MASSNHHPALHRSEQHQQRRTGRILAVLLFFIVVGCAIAFPVLFVLHKDDDGAPPLTGDEEQGVDVIVTFEHTETTMSDAQRNALQDACFQFYTLNLAGMRLSGVSVISQMLVADRREDETLRQRQRQLQQPPAMALRTTLRVVPERVNTTLTSLQLATLMDTEGEELLSLLQRESNDEYFDTFQIVYATAITSPTTAPTTVINDDGTCNGLANLCDISVSDILFATMHNANADRSVSPLFPNHNQDLMAGLQAGIRGINMDLGFCNTGKNGTVLAFLHTTCILGFSDARQVLTNIHHWLTANPNQVIIMPIQMENGGVQPVRIREHVAPLFESIVDNTGRTMAERLYAHNNKDGTTTVWPTLRELIAADERILFFFYNSDESCQSIDCPRGFHDWFAYAAESEFVFSSVESIAQNGSRACGMTRGNRGTRDFYGVNLFLEVPNQEASAVLNQADFLSTHLEECAKVTGLLPNLVLVDFWDEGDVMQVVQERNAQLPLTPPPSNTTPSSPSLVTTETPVPSPLVDTLSPSASSTTREMTAPTAVNTTTTTSPPILAPTAVNTTTTSPPAPSSTATRVCNGLSNLCDMPVNATLFATMHNAHADRESNFFLPNHDLNLLAGLQAGIRGLAMDIGLCPVDGVSKLSLVHGVCFVGIGDPFLVFAGINNFLQQNPNEVIIMPTQINDNSGGTVQLTEILMVMEQVVNDAGVSMADRLYAHPGRSTPWPTLGELIDADKRILFFIYNGEQTCESGCPVGFHDWFAYAMETKFEFSDAATILNDPEDACVVTRGGSSSTRSFFGVNVFTRVASAEASAQLNNATFLRQHIETCSTVNSGKDPNLLLVDFWNTGDVIQVAQEYNAQLGTI